MTRVYKEGDRVSEGDLSNTAANRSSDMPNPNTSSHPSALPKPGLLRNNEEEKQPAAPAASLRPKPDANTDPKALHQTARSNEQLSTNPQTLCPKARLRIHLEDITHPAVTTFTANIPLATILRTAITHVQAHLFTPPLNNTSQARPNPHPKRHWTPQEVRSITLCLRDVDGVAYTTGTDLDEAHKEIHLSLNYVHDVIKKFTSSTNSSATPTKPPTTATTATALFSPIPSPPTSSATAAPTPKFDARAFTHEIFGVITHEMVHCFQHNGRSTCPGGLIEGIADYVRMKSGLSAPHWKKFPADKHTRGEKWDEGYQKTAWFLEWVEQEIGGRGCIGELNEMMRDHEWDDGKLWEKTMNGVTVDECWTAYKGAWEGMKNEHAA